jgi:hypothetical protein
MATGSIDLGKLPARFVVAGLVTNVFQSPAGEKDGRKYGGDFRLQLLSADHLRNGESKVVPSEVSLGTDEKDAATYRAKVGQLVHLPVSVYPAGNGLGMSLAADRKLP